MEPADATLKGEVNAGERVTAGHRALGGDPAPVALLDPRVGRDRAVGHRPAAAGQHELAGAADPAALGLGGDRAADLDGGVEGVALAEGGEDLLQTGRARVRRAARTRSGRSRTSQQAWARPSSRIRGRAAPHSAPSSKTRAARPGWSARPRAIDPISEAGLRRSPSPSPVAAVALVGLLLSPWPQKPEKPWTTSLYVPLPSDFSQANMPTNVPLKRTNRTWPLVFSVTVPPVALS